MKLHYLSFLLLSITYISAQQKNIDSVIVLGKIPIEKTTITSTRLHANDLKRNTSYHLIDDLHGVSNLNLQTRGFHASQSDIGIRNGNYEQVGIFFNGIRLNNPTTGHNNLNFPFTRQSIETIDIVKGGSGKFFGNNSLSGTIAFSTVKPKSNGLNGEFSLGSFSNLNQHIEYNHIGKKTWHKIAASYWRVADYRPNTDNETMQLMSENHFEFIKNIDLYATVAIHSKKFGANGFYSQRFPNQYEEIQSYFYNVGASSKNLKLDFYWNQINDYFILRRENPRFYANRHYTNVYGILLTGNKELSKDIKISGSAELRAEDLKSNNLGTRNRVYYNLNGNMDFRPFRPLLINMGINVSKLNDFDLFTTGGMHITYKIQKQLHIYSSLNSAFRTPSFTELYYTSPTDSGNSNLSPEKAYNIEAGYHYKTKAFAHQMAVYYRICNNQIDWVKDDVTSTIYRSLNFSSIRHYGIESSITLQLKDKIGAAPIESIQFSFAHNQFSLDSNQNARYSFSLLQNQFIAHIFLKISKKIHQTLSIRIEDRPALGKVFALLDTKFIYDLPIKNTSFFLTIQNLTNTKYEYFTGLPMPGINFQSGFRFSL